MNLNIFHRIGLTIYVTKTALSAGISWLVASWVSHNHFPYFAALGAILSIQLTVADSIIKALQRVIGIIGGVVVSIIIGFWLPVNPVSVTLVVLIGMAFSTALRLHPQIKSQVAVSSLLVLAFGNTPGYAVDRIVETIIGCVIAVLLNTLFIPPNPIPEAEKYILHLSEYAGSVLNTLALGYQERVLRPADMPYVQELVDETKKTHQAVQLALQSLRYSPLLQNKRSRVLALSRVISGFERITIEIRGIARGLVDLGHDVQPNPYLTEAITSTAACVGLFAKQEIYHSDEREGVLGLSIEEAQKRQNRCLLDMKETESLELLRNMGSILTDLNRILDEVKGRARFVST